MSILKLIIKSVIAYYLTVFIFKPDTMAYTVVMFALMYGLATCYIWYFTYYVVGTDLLDYGLFKLFCVLVSPPFAIGIGYYILDAILPGRSGQYFFSVIILISSFRCLIHDIVSIIRKS